MALMQHAYDDPAYRAPVLHSANLAAASASEGNKFVAFTTTLLKSMTSWAAIIGTGAAASTFGPIISAIKISGTNTTTLVTHTWGSGNLVGTMTGLYTALAVNTLVQGDVIYAAKGTDGTLVASAVFEMYIAPGASLTV